MTTDLSDAYPEWAREVSARLTATSQLVLVGNVDDDHLAPAADEPDAAPADQDVPLEFQTTAEIVCDCLKRAGYTVVLCWNAVNGLTVLYEANPGEAADTAGAKAWEKPRECTTHSLSELLQAVVRKQGVRAALIVEGAPRLAPDPQDPQLHSVYAIARQLSLDAPRGRVPTDARVGLRNLVVWAVARETDLPYWLIAAEGVRVVSVPEPTLETRHRAARALSANLPGFAELGEAGRREALDTLADHAQGMSLTDMRAAALVARDRRIDAAEIADAVRFLRSGVQASPWSEPAVRRRIGESVKVLNDVVLGQEHAVRKTIDALSRAALGLSGAQSAGHPNRPRGVLFFAGPTGVGKTELAKQIAKAVFGRAEATERFDMSEYSAEHSEARLLGAPPGYVGHDAGGELTNAVRRRPFSLLLFDEIDKAHERILDKFLQVLEDGRLTDSAGGTVHFTDTFIVFTSNLGVYREREDGTVEPIIEPGTEYSEVDTTVRNAVHQHFTKIKRPELLNRIGLNNIVVFNFIPPESARLILRKSVANLERVVRRNTDISVTVGPRALAELDKLIVLPENLAFGGRAVGAVVESHLVNPLSRELLLKPGSTSYEVADIRNGEFGPAIDLRETTRL